MATSDQKLTRILLRPQVLVSLLILMTAIIWTWSPRPQPQVVLPNLRNSLSQEVLQTETIQLTSYDSRGLEQPRFITTELPSTSELRYQTIISLLRQELLTDIWPEELPEPVVYVYQSGARRTVILDFILDRMPEVSIGQEWQLLQSLGTTLLRNGATDWRVLVNNRGSRTFMSHLALPTQLD